MSMLEKYYRINQAAGISIHIHNDGSLGISLCSVSVENNQLEIIKKHPEVVGFDELKKLIEAKTPVAVNLFGKGILHKKIDRTEDINPSNFNSVLPNAKPDDFYIQNFISGDYSFVSVIRKTDADKWITALTDLGLAPLMLSLGSFPVQNIISQLNVYGSEIIFNGNIILRDDSGNWTDYRYDESAKTPFALKVDMEGINEKTIIPYACAFQLVLAAKLDVIEANAASLQTAFQQKMADNKLKAQGFLVLAIFFILLLINYGLLSWFNSTNTQLARQASVTAQSAGGIDQLNKEIKYKDSIVHVLGWEAGINKSALVDQVASMLPPELTWKEVALNPIDLATTRVKKSLSFYSRRIRITGNSEKIIPVNEWIARVKTKPWVKDVQLDNYTYNSELNTGQFTITISY